MSLEKMYRELYAETCKKEAVAVFTIGWLTSVLADTGMSKEEIQKHVAEGRAEGEKIFNK